MPVARMRNAAKLSAVSALLGTAPRRPGANDATCPTESTANQNVESSYRANLTASGADEKRSALRRAPKRPAVPFETRSGTLSTMPWRRPRRVVPWLTLLAGSIGTLGSASRASAQEASVQPADTPAAADTTRVPIHIDAEGSVRVASAAGVEHCTAPCTLHVEPGYVTLKVGDVSQELFVEGPSRVTLTAGAPAVRKVALVALVAGAVVVVAAVALPLIFCRQTQRVDAFGRPQPNDDPCRNLTDGFKVGWISGAGIGLTAAIAGGIVFASAGPKLRLSVLNPGSVAQWPVLSPLAGDKSRSQYLPRGLVLSGEF